MPRKLKTSNYQLPGTPMIRGRAVFASRCVGHGPLRRQRHPAKAGSCRFSTKAQHASVGGKRVCTCGCAVCAVSDVCAICAVCAASPPAPSALCAVNKSIGNCKEPTGMKAQQNSWSPACSSPCARRKNRKGPPGRLCEKALPHGELVGCARSWPSRPPCSCDSLLAPWACSNTKLDATCPKRSC